MRTSIAIACILLAVALVTVGCGDKKTEQAATPPKAGAGAAAMIAQKTCPVMGGAIDKDIFVEHEGRKIYFCCDACPAVFKKDPAKYIQKLEAEGITVAKLQTECPVMGGAIDKALYVDYDGKRIYVCCQGCIATIKANPTKFIKKPEADGITLDPAGK